MIIPAVAATTMITENVVGENRTIAAKSTTVVKVHRHRHPMVVATVGAAVAIGVTKLRFCCIHHPVVHLNRLNRSTIIHAIRKIWKCSNLLQISVVVHLV